METTAADSRDRIPIVDNDAAKIHDRIHKRNQARIEDAERRKEAKENQSVPEEKGKYFSQTFYADLSGIEELLCRCSGAEPAEVTRILEEATARTVPLQKFLNDSVLFLTPYDLRKAQSALQELQGSIAETRERVLPKKKFTFRARTRVAEKEADPPGGVNGGSNGSANGSHPTSGEANGGGGGATTPAEAAAADLCGFSNMEGETLTKTSEEIQKQDVLLTHLTNCKVRLLGSPGRLHLKHIDGCQILCGPVASSVFVDHCRNSTLAFPCQQLRVHSTTDTRVYLHVTCRAIIEDSRGVSVAPFSWSYPTLDQDFEVSGLDRERNNWNEMDDFNWLAAGSPSPNWTVLPEEERKTNWDD